MGHCRSREERRGPYALTAALLAALPGPLCLGRQGGPAAAAPTRSQAAIICIFQV